MKNERQIFNFIAEQEQKLYGPSYQFERQSLKDCALSEHDERRISYYLGDIGKQPVAVNTSSASFQADLKRFNLSVNDYATFVQAAIEQSIPKHYCFSVIKIFNFLDDDYKKLKFVYAWGDSSRHISADGVIAKTRFIDDTSISLLKLNPMWHWSKVHGIAKFDIDYRRKKSMAVWRGTTTGLNKTIATRYELVDRYFSNKRFNVAFSHLTKDPEVKRYASLVKGKMTLAKQLQYKCLICVEGNDVATALKWMINSNSVVMMAKPTVCSWFMEDHLQPYIHYIPLKSDFSDLDERFEWAMRNEDACLEIINNASRFINPFLDAQRELAIECEVMKRYLKNIQIV